MASNPLSLERKKHYWRGLVRNTPPNDERLLGSYAKELRSALRDALDALDAMEHSDALLIGKKIESMHKSHLQ